ncbi:calcineurin-like phosphoesterase [Apiospora phragmitis]|uniref:Calcineurin-like phosphoesterase n=1 Tax=Apiospora phragmitis TaxID=2905665 RepID=A0ABR1T7I8_9PEZI
MELVRRLNGFLRYLGLRRSSYWDKPALLDEWLESPLKAMVVRLYCISSMAARQSHQAATQSASYQSDLLIHAGDLTQGGTAAEIQAQLDWLDTLPHTHKVLISGNHDRYFDIKTRHDEDTLTHARLDFKRIHYLERKSVTLSFKGQRRLNIFGAPDIIGPTGTSSTNAFQYDAGHHPWREAVPRNTDVLITHGPPRHHLDLNLGCSGLLRDGWRVKPKLHVFGHIHCSRGTQSVFWDSCQLGYENFLSRKMRGPLLGHGS